METLKLYRLRVVDHCGQIRMDISGSTHIFIRCHPRLLIFYGNQALRAQQREYTHQWLQQDSDLCHKLPCVGVCSVAQSCLTLWSHGLVACQAPLSGILQARILELVTISSSRGFSWPRDQIRLSWVSWVGRWILYYWATWEAPTNFLTRDNLHTDPRWKIFLFLNYVK